jgi:hypothetical protein
MTTTTQVRKRLEAKHTHDHRGKQRGNARGEPAGATQTATTPEADETRKLGGAASVCLVRQGTGGSAGIARRAWTG